MRVNVYSEELTGKFEVVTKTVEGTEFVGIRFYLELPAVKGQARVSGPFTNAGRDDSSAVTFWTDEPERLKDLFLRITKRLDQML